MKNNQGGKRKKALLVAFLLLCFAVASVSAAPPNWIRAEDGLPASTSEPSIFRFGPDVYLMVNNDLFVQLYNQPCFGWNQVEIPSGVTSFSPVGDYLFATGSDLWWIEKGDAIIHDNWHKVTSSGLPSGASINVRTSFNGQLYGFIVYFKAGATQTTFDIYRSPDIGKTTMTWTKVVAEGFGDPQNHSLGYLGVFKNKLVAITTVTRNGLFGDLVQYLDGIEVWESPTGDPNSWTQVNEDGFGTMVAGSVDRPEPFATNVDIGAAAEFNGYLYVGTKSHLGAEIWRYDGTGKAGWTNVTPPTLGVVLSGGPGRVESMVVFQNLLYVAEGFPTANLDRYDGTTWTIVENGPNPFDASNSSLPGLAVSSRSTTGEKLFVQTAVFGGGYQVWSYPFTDTPVTCSALKQATISLSPKTATNELGTPGQTHTVTAKVDAGSGADFSDVFVTGSIEVVQANGVSTAIGFVDPNGLLTLTYTALQGPTGLHTDTIEACFYPPGEAICDNATKTWVDTTPPAITISTPQDGAKYVLNAVVHADYSVQDAVGVASTNAPVPDGSPIATGQMGTHVFTVVATDYGQNTTAKSVTYEVLQPPIAEAGPAQTTLVGLPVSFDGSGSSDPDGTIVAYVWNFGDGTTGTGVNTSHTYSSSGLKTVTLTVTDDDGLTDSDTVEVTVKTPVAGTQDLMSEVVNAALPPDIESGLTDKLAAAIDALNNGQEKTAINILKSFKNMVNAQRGKALTDAQADAWIAAAQKIADSINAS